MHIKVKVTPDSKKERVIKESDISYKIQVKEPAERNMANTRVRQLLADELGLQKGKVKIISGHRSLSKMFSVETD